MSKVVLSKVTICPLIINKFIFWAEGGGEGGQGGVKREAEKKEELELKEKIDIKVFTRLQINPSKNRWKNHIQRHMGSNPLTNQRTNQRTDGRTKSLIEVLCLRLKSYDATSYIVDFHHCNKKNLYSSAYSLDIHSISQMKSLYYFYFIYVSKLQHFSSNGLEMAILRS
jgi:hypothetical protein